MAVPESETLHLKDGTEMSLMKMPGMSDEEWQDAKKMMEENPDTARKVESFCKDFKSVKKYMQAQAVKEYYQSADENTADKLLSLEMQPELAHIFEEIKRFGTRAAAQHTMNEPLMSKVSKAVGGLPSEVKETLRKIQANPINLQEACLKGDIKAVEDYIAMAKDAGKMDIDAQDHKGITCLGYAVGGNRVNIVKLLLSEKADPSACDASGGTALHYAAAYGRQDLASFLIDGGLEVNAKTKAGQTPLALATKNKQKAMIEFLKTKGGEA